MSTSFDYVIVGAGSAGCVLANRLSADGDAEVLLLEAGIPDEKEAIHIPGEFVSLMQSEVDWGYTTVPQSDLNGREVYWPRGKTLGGTSAINALMYVRGNPADFDRWASLGNDGWGWPEMLQVYKRLEDYEGGDEGLHGTGGPLHVEPEHPIGAVSGALIDAAVEAGLDRNEDLNGQTQKGVGPFHVTVKDGRRQSTAVAYLKPVLDRDNLTTETGAHVTEVLFEGNRATGVMFVQDGNRKEVEAEEVILSAGVIESPRLLMLSGVGPADHLQEHGIDTLVDLPGVGRSLKDHLRIGVFYECTEDPEMESHQTICQVTGFERSEARLPAPDIQYFLSRWALPNPLFDIPEDVNTMYLNATLLHPESAGRITLASDDPFIDPVIDPNYLDAGVDVQTLVRGFKRVREIGETDALDRVRGAGEWPERIETDGDIREYIRADAASVHHQIGTAKMGNDDMAVVDDRLCVHGVSGLRVVDASIMPELTSGNTNAPTIAIAERASDFIRNGG